MEYVYLGKTGLKVSKLCLGCMTYSTEGGGGSGWMLDEAASRPFIQEALDSGINFFDTAEVYSAGASEEVLGRALKDSGVDRDDLVIATKVLPNLPAALGSPGLPNRRGLSRKHIIAACDASLKRLQTDYIDLYQIHRIDPFVPMEETAEAMSDLVRAGKVRYIGASNTYAFQFAKYLALAEQHGWVRFTTMQPQYSLVYREEEREMLRLCAEEGIGVIPWGPMAGGFLAGNRNRQGDGETARAKSSPKTYLDADYKVADATAEVAQRLGVKPVQVALAWVLANPIITAPIIGASKPGHIQDALGALEINLSAEDKSLLEEHYQYRMGFEF